MTATKPQALVMERKPKNFMAKVLIYERRAETACILNDAFKSSGFEVSIVRDVDEIPPERFDIFVTEIENSKEIVEVIEKRNPLLRIIIFSNFSRDKYIEELYKKGINIALRQSYKLRDLISMSKFAVRKHPDEMFGVEKLLINGSELSNNKKVEFKIDKKNVEEAAIGDKIFCLIDDYLKSSDLIEKIEDIDMFHYSIGELIDNSIEAQLKAGLTKLEIFLEYGFDDEKIAFSLYDKLGELRPINVINGITKKIKQSEDSDENEKLINIDYRDGTYFGHQGRGYFIVQHGVHRIIVTILTPENAGKYNTFPRSNSTLIVYFNKKFENLETQIGPCGISMVISI